MEKKIRINRIYLIMFTIIILTIFAAGCGTDEMAGGEKPPQPIHEAGILNLIDQNILNVENIQVTGEGFGTTGEIFSVSVKNTGTDPLDVKIPCGLVFTPSDNSFQPMMVIQKETASAAPGETVSLSPYVVCIDAEAEIPDTEADYAFGYMESGDLLKLANCLCEDADTITDPMGVQFSVWMLSDDINPDDLSKLSGEAFQSLVGDQMDENIPAELQSILENTFGLSGDGNSQGWLERCKIR